VRVGCRFDAWSKGVAVREQRIAARAERSGIARWQSQRIVSYNFWNKFEFEYSLNFKGIQTFL
jgi:hypothetical protein